MDGLHLAAAHLLQAETVPEAAFRHERVFEIMALACGKIDTTQASGLGTPWTFKISEIKFSAPCTAVNCGGCQSRVCNKGLGLHPCKAQALLPQCW